MTEQTKFQEITVLAYNLEQFLVDFQDAITKGYRLDLTRNDTYPQMINNQYWVTLVQSGKVAQTVATVKLEVDTSEVKEIVEKALEEVKQEQEIQAKGKPGRKPKSE